MAIFGDLVDMPTPEVLRMLGPRTGRLYLRPTERKQYELHLHGGSLLCLKVAGFSVRDPAELRRSVAEALRLDRGAFEFEASPPEGLLHEVNLSRREVSEIVAALDLKAESAQAEPPKAELPDRETRFKLRPGAATDLELPDNLKTFMARAHAPLSAGCSVGELADALGFHPAVVKLYLTRLRALGKVAPVRAYAADYRGYRADVPATPPETAPVPAAPPVRSAPPTAPSNQAPSRKGFFRRLLSALSFGGR